MAPEDFKRIVESLRVPVAVADREGAIVFANAAFAQMVGRTAKDLPGVNVASLFADGDQKRLLQNMVRVAEGKSASALLEARTGGKAARWVQATLSPALDAREHAAGVIVALQDTETHRDTEEALNLATARLLSLAEASPAPTMIENARGEVELVNEAFCTLLGIDSAPQSLTGLPSKDVFARAKKKRKDVKRQPILVDDVEVGGLWLSAAAAPEPGDKSASEIALIEKIGEELSVALEGISAITIRAQQMEFDPVLIEHFARIRASTETAVAAIGDLVDFSNVSGGVVLHKSEFGLRSALAELIKRVAPEAEERGCRLRVRIEQDVADQLEGDVERLQLLLKNLLDNTFMLVPGAEVKLHITPEYVTESGIQLSFSVSATLEGGEKPVPRYSPESGMGVAVARFMVTAMGGKLAIASRPGNEALYSFTIEFPVRAAPPAPRRATHASVVGMGVLVVSADPEQRYSLTNTLRAARLIPMEADNPEMAIKLLERMLEEDAPIPLVIVADELPVQDGFMVAFRVKHHPKLGATILMMLAAKGKPGDAIACRESGISAYMRYPINDRQLNEAIVAVTGASVDADETPTLVTRHSLREQRKGATVLLVDASRDSQILASHILSKRDCNVVAAQDVPEALAALEQDFYDVVLVDPSVPGMAGSDGPAKLRSAIQRDADKVHFVACGAEHSPAWSAERKAEGYNATLGKPFNKDHLLAALAAIGRLPEE